MEPPPSSTWQVHIPQVPPPPHADGRKMPLLESVLRIVFPGLTVISFSFRVRVTSPWGVSFFLANSSMATSKTITSRNTAMLTRMIIMFDASSII
jgi:hypothetical protein